MLEAKKSPLLLEWDKLPGGKWEWIVFLTIARGINQHKHIHGELCGSLEGSEKENCKRRVREALKGLKDKGIVYRKKRYGKLHSYLTTEGKILAAKVCEACQP